MSSFVATAGSAEELEDLDTFVVVLAEMPDGDGARLEIQRGLTIDPQDEALGMDTYCLCTQTGASHYGGIRSWRLEDGCLHTSLDDMAASELGLDPQVTIELRLAGSGGPSGHCRYRAGAGDAEVRVAMSPPSGLKRPIAGVCFCCLRPPVPMRCPRLPARSRGMSTALRFARCFPSDPPASPGDPHRVCSRAPRSSLLLP